MIHRPSSRAQWPRKACIGPSPGISATSTLSASRWPMMAKFSGNTASVAPSTRARSSKVRAEARLASTSGAEVICSTAAIELVTCYFRLGGGRIDALHHRIVPRTGDAIVAARDALGGLLEILRKRQHGRAARGTAGERARQCRRRTEISSDDGRLIVVTRPQTGSARDADLRR